MDTRKPVKVEPKEMTTLSLGFPMLGRLAREFDWFFDRFGREPFGSSRPSASGRPRSRCSRRTASSFSAGSARAEEEEVSVEVTDKGLVLKGERRREKEEKGENFYRAERSYGAFCRVLPLPETAKFDEAKAVMRDGVLEVTMPVAKAEQKTRRLEIKEPAAGERKHAA